MSLATVTRSALRVSSVTADRGILVEAKHGLVFHVQVADTWRGPFRCQQIEGFKTDERWNAPYWGSIKDIKEWVALTEECCRAHIAHDQVMAELENDALDAAETRAEAAELSEDGAGQDAEQAAEQAEEDAAFEELFAQIPVVVIPEVTEAAYEAQLTEAQRLEAEYEAKGRADHAAGRPNYYGCHIGFRSTRDLCAAAFHRGWNAADAEHIAALQAEARKTGAEHHADREAAQASDTTMYRVTMRRSFGPFREPVTALVGVTPVPGRPGYHFATGQDVTIALGCGKDRIGAREAIFVLLEAEGYRLLELSILLPEPPLPPAPEPLPEAAPNADPAPIAAGDTIVVTAEVFDALNRAGLLMRWGWSHGTSSIDGQRWPVWGESLDDGSVRCIIRPDIEDAARR